MIVVFAGGQAALVGVFGFYLGPLVIHSAHGNWGKGLLSLGIGAGATLLDAFALSEIDRRSNDGRTDPDLGGVAAVAGSLLGGLVYVIVDVVALAWETKPVPSAVEKAEAPSLRLAPNVWVAQNQTTFGLSGEF